eukprot:ANDGO_08478.mRNA.1 hypothetical protein PTSG_06673
MENKAFEFFYGGRFDADGSDVILLEVTEAQLAVFSSLPSFPAGSSSAPASSSVSFKGRPDDLLVLCTDCETFSVRAAETSNSLLLFPSAPSAVALPVVSDSEVRYVQSCNHSILEIARTNPRLSRIEELLKKKYYKPHEELLTTLDLYTLQALETEVQASRAEILAGLRAIKALQVNGFWRLAEPNTRHFVTNFILDSCVELNLSIPVAAHDLDACTRMIVERTEGHPDLDPMLIAHFLGCMSSVDAAVFRTEQLLSRSPVWPMDDLLDILGSSLPRGSFFSIDSLYDEGLFLVDGLMKTVTKFSKRQLSNDPSTRFRALFQKKVKWTAAEIEPFIRDIREIGLPGESFLIKYARVNQKLKADDQVTYSSRE